MPDSTPPAPPAVDPVTLRLVASLVEELQKNRDIFAAQASQRRDMEWLLRVVRDGDGDKPSVVVELVTLNHRVQDLDDRVDGMTAARRATDAANTEGRWQWRTQVATGLIAGLVSLGVALLTR